MIFVPFLFSLNLQKYKPNDFKKKENLFYFNIGPVFCPVFLMVNPIVGWIQLKPPQPEQGLEILLRYK